MAVSTASTHGSLVALQQPLLLQDLMHDTTFDIGQTEIAAAVAVGQAGMVEATLVQERGVKVVEGGRAEWR